MGLGYDNFFTSAGLAIPVGSRNVPSVFGGMNCPQSMSIGRAHGTSPAICEAQFDGNVYLQVGTVQSAQIDGATFTGLLTKVEIETTGEEGVVTKFKMVDMRDKLHDVNMFGQFNMLDESGRWYHIYYKDWQTQYKRYITSYTIDDIDDEEDFPEDDCEQTLLSAFTILNGIGVAFGFSLEASSDAMGVLKKGIPDNMDWNAGVKVIDAVQQVLDKFGLQFTCWGNLTLYITIRGFSDSPFVNQLASGSFNICGSIYQAGSYSIGSELGELPRRIIVVGDSNQVQENFPLYPAWNINKWNFDFVYNGLYLSALLKSKGLSLLSTMKELPKEYQHPKEKWRGKDVGDMSIKEYLETFPFKVYVVDFGVVAGVEDQPHDDGFDIYPSIYPISDSLVDDSNIRHRTFGTLLIYGRKGQYDPLDDAGGLANLTDGVSLEVDDTIVNPDDCLYQCNAYVVFSKPRITKANPREVHGRTLYDYTYDRSLSIDISQDVGKYTYAAGVSQGSSPRIRESIRYVAGLKRCKLFGEEVAMLKLNFGSHATVKADEVAKVIAAQALMHSAISTAGYVTFQGVAGIIPDGIIDSVNVTFDSENGATETANFTTAVNNDEQFALFRPINKDTSDLYVNEERLRTEFLINAARKADAVAVPDGVKVAGDGLIAASGPMNPAMAAIAYGSDGIVRASLDLDDNATVQPNDLVILTT